LRSETIDQAAGEKRRQEHAKHMPLDNKRNIADAMMMMHLAPMIIEAGMAVSE
jgi:hypothetical protein